MSATVQYQHIPPAPSVGRWMGTVLPICTAQRPTPCARGAAAVRNAVGPQPASFVCSPGATSCRRARQALSAASAAFSEPTMGKSKLGKLEVKLDKPYYVVGEMVTGTLYVETSSGFPIGKIYVKAKGKEKVCEPARSCVHCHCFIRICDIGCPTRCRGKSTGRHLSLTTRVIWLDMTSTKRSMTKKTSSSRSKLD